MPCNAIDKAMIGRRELWMRCGLGTRHAGPHHDPKRPNHYWSETFYFGEFEPGRPKVAESKLKRKSSRCSKCDLPFKQGVSFAGFCVCRDVRPDESRNQKSMFAEDEKRAYWNQENADMDAFFIGILAEHEQRIANDPDAYYGLF